MDDTDFARSSVLEILIPEDQDLDIEESLHAAAAKDPDQEGDGPLWSSIPQRDLLFFGWSPTCKSYAGPDLAAAGRRARHPLPPPQGALHGRGAPAPPDRAPGHRRRRARRQRARRARRGPRRGFAAAEHRARHHLVARARRGRGAHQHPARRRR